MIKKQNIYTGSKGGVRVIYYEMVCLTCKQIVQIEEGTKLYKQFKENPNEKRMCQDCVEKIEKDAKKQLMG